MFSLKSPHLGLFAAGLLTLLAWSCSVPSLSTSPSTPGSTSKGSLTITVGNNINARTLAPAIDMNAASFTVTGTGPNNATFTQTTSGSSVTVASLAFGSWTIVVNATNATGDLIGTGTTTAQVNTGATTTASVTVTPIAGVGTLTLGVTWPASQVQTPTINASLTPALGSAQSLPFTVSGSNGTASYSNTSVGNGYYTLDFTLLDNNIVEAGAVDVVRIVTGQTTSGNYTFTSVNAPGGTIQVGITANLQNPLTVAISGATVTLAQGSTEALTASVSNYSGNVVYVWYVNGVASGTGPTFNFNAGSVVGYSYRVDVTAFSADGTQAGSATTTIQTTAPALGTVVYNGNGNTSGTVPVDSTVHAQGSAVTVLGNIGNLVNTGYQFAGWTTATATSSTSGSYAVGTSFPMGATNVTLYAVWIPNFLTFSSVGTEITVTGTNSPPVGTLVIPRGVTSIGQVAFVSSTALTGITIPSSVTSIGLGAFEVCTGLTSITIPASVTSIGAVAFVDCTALTTISVAPGNSSFESDSFGVLFNTGKTTLIAAPGKLSGVYSIPSTVTTISGSAFQDCQVLTGLSIPSNVTTIGGGAFSLCSSLTSITIPATVTSLGDGLLNSCTSLTSASLPSNLTSIGPLMFQGCSSLTSITIPNSVTSIGDQAFNGAGLTSVQIPPGVTSIGNAAFSANALSNVTIPASVTTLGTAPFSGNRNLASISVAIGNTSFHSDNFGVLFNSTGTALIEAPGALSGTYFIPSSVTNIAQAAFFLCPSLGGVNIPTSVSSISQQAFELCANLASVSLSSTVPPTLSANSSSFDGDASSLTIHVPTNGAVLAYQAATGWDSYASKIVAP